MPNKLNSNIYENTFEFYWNAKKGENKRKMKKKIDEKCVD